MSREVYDYRDAAGGYVFSVVVERAQDGSKRVLQGVRAADGSFAWGLNGIAEPPLYRLPELVAHRREGRRDPIYIVEGEKCVEALRFLGLTATTNPMGAGKWRDWHTEMLIGAFATRVVADLDDPGRAHARAVFADVRRVVADSEALQPPADLGDGADVADLLAAGRDLDELEPLADVPPIDAEEIEPRSEAWTPLPLPEAASAPASVIERRGRGLIYSPRAIVLVSSEPGVGKSMILATFVADEATAGRTALYLDFERTAELLLERLQAAGLGDEELGRVHYHRPRSPASRDEIAAMIERLDPSLVALDSYDAALALYGLETSNEDVRIFAAAVIEPLRSRGASILVADHVPKDREKRGRYSIGGQAKLALADAHLGLSVIAPLRRGAEGKLRVRALKDTFGYLPSSAVFTLRSHEVSGALSWDVTAAEDADEDGGEFRPTGYMERVSRELERRGEFVSRSELERSVQGKAKHVRQAIDALIREEYAEETDGLRGARLVRSLRPFREDDE